MNIEKRVIELVEEKITDRDDLFLVEVKVAVGGKVSILMDGDQGITIQDCAAISRHVGFHMEEEGLMDTSYQLEVSSPGIDTPLKLKRQFRKNIGRKVSVRLVNGEKHEGKLLNEQVEGIILEETIKEKGNKAIVKESFFPFSELTETKVLISFK